ncbi:hypothetical protein C6A87_022070 [Mycobacterium sp. ITM-2016-00317]|uniref:hypothetical protein n=1 Tax=Mycobacterium sp. ITM-2016-00317 TaxID=2099694 RepID=UPI00287F58FB|nr:hypothetical protein [Mycobacterium sp. ITM-2016-00317]WNG86501.1 hypothetical protein C6A87_022070 [Mycobacterium sp. ITM-2016-00317]
MTTIVERLQGSDAATREPRLTWLTAAFAVVASLAVMLPPAPPTVSPAAYWTVSSIALLTVLVVFVAGQAAWDRSVEQARTAGLVEEDQLTRSTGSAPSPAWATASARNRRPERPRPLRPSGATAGYGHRAMFRRTRPTG